MKDVLPELVGPTIIALKGILLGSMAARSDTFLKNLLYNGDAKTGDGP